MRQALLYKMFGSIAEANFCLICFVHLTLRVIPILGCAGRASSWWTVVCSVNAKHNILDKQCNKDFELGEYHLPVIRGRPSQWADFIKHVQVRLLKECINKPQTNFF